MEFILFNLPGLIGCLMVSYAGTTLIMNAIKGDDIICELGEVVEESHMEPILLGDISDNV